MNSGVKQSRRMKRMNRNRNKAPGLNLVSLMDVFTILVFFLLVNSASSDVKEPPKEITLPASAVDSKPRETVAITITEQAILVQGEAMVSTQDALQAKMLTQITEKLVNTRKRALGLAGRAEQQEEVTILSHKSIPFKLVKKVMTSATEAGYTKISLAVVQKAAKAQTVN